MTPERKVRIAFGTLFRAKNELGPGRVEVVVDVGQGEWLQSAPIEQGDEGVWLGLPGTTTTDYITEIVGQMTLKEVLRAAEAGARRQGYELTDNQREILREYSQREPREIS